MTSKEFTTLPHERDPLLNLERTLKTAKQSTQESYLKKFHAFLKSYGSLKDAVDGVQSKRELGLLSYATLRLYKSCLLYGTALLLACHRQHALPHFLTAEQKAHLFTLASDYTPADLEAFYAQIFDWRAEESFQRHLLDSVSLSINETSNRRAKSFHPDLTARLLSVERKSFRFLKVFIQLNLILGLRPHEYFHSQVVEDKTSRYDSIPADKQPLFEKYQSSSKPCRFWLQVKNAKYSDDPDNPLKRACGEYRYLGLDDLGADTIKLLHGFCANIRKKCNTEYDFKNLLHTEQRRLARFFKSDAVSRKIIEKEHAKQVKKYQNKLKGGHAIHTLDDDAFLIAQASKLSQIEYPTLYSTRHQAIANAKATGINDIMIASLFGHISPSTNRMHYGKKHHGNTTCKLVPSAQNLLSVMEHVQEQALTQQRKKALKQGKNIEDILLEPKFTS